MIIHIFYLQRTSYLQSTYDTLKFRSFLLLCLFYFLRLSKVECCASLKPNGESICALGPNCGNRLFEKREYAKVGERIGWGERRIKMKPETEHGCYLLWKIDYHHLLLQICAIVAYTINNFRLLEQIFKPAFFSLVIFLLCPLSLPPSLVISFHHPPSAIIICTP